MEFSVLSLSPFCFAEQDDITATVCCEVLPQPENLLCADVLNFPWKIRMKLLSPKAAVINLGQY